MDILASAALNSAQQKLRLFMGKVFVFLCVIAFSQPMSAANLGGTPSLFDLGSTWQDQDAKPFTWRDDRFQWTVLSMVYTSCQNSCPLITQKLQMIEKNLPDRLKGHVRFLLFSFDPANDKPQALKKFAQKHQLSSASWSLLTSNAHDARGLAVALDFRFKKLENGDFTHSNQITLLNSAGNIVGQTSQLSEAVNFISQKIAETK